MRAIYMYLRRLDVPGGSACSNYMYDLFVFTLVGIYANMAEMSGVRQTDGFVRFFWKFGNYFKIIKWISGNQLDQIKLYLFIY